MNKQFSHTLQDGQLPNMVDVSSKENSLRKAKACGFIRLSGKTIILIREDK